MNTKNKSLPIGTSLLITEHPTLQAKGRLFFCKEHEEVGKKYRLENKDRKKEYQKKYYAKNKEKLKKYKKKYHTEHKEEARLRNKKYFQTPKGKLATKRSNIKRRAHGVIKMDTFKRLLNANILKHGMICCERCKKGCIDNRHIDHILPISKGGDNSYDNLQIFCSHCNCSKHADIIDYRQNKNNKQMFLKT